MNSAKGWDSPNQADNAASSVQHLFVSYLNPVKPQSTSTCSLELGFLTILD